MTPQHVRLAPDDVARRARAIKLVLTDCDGVLTDAGVYYSARGEELRRFSVRDGMGVERLRERGITTAIVTREPTEQVLRRAEKLRIRAYVGIQDKLAALSMIVSEAGIDEAAVLYVGDDVNDLLIMEAVAARGGLLAAPADAMDGIAAIAHLVTAARGGHGAFREVAEWLIAARAR